jgi:hypothetical protein
MQRFRRQRTTLRAIAGRLNSPSEMKKKTTVAGTPTIVPAMGGAVRPVAPPWRDPASHRLQLGYWLVRERQPIARPELLPSKATARWPSSRWAKLWTKFVPGGSVIGVLPPGPMSVAAPEIDAL